MVDHRAAHQREDQEYPLTEARPAPTWFPV